MRIKINKFNEHVCTYIYLFIQDLLYVYTACSCWLSHEDGVVWAFVGPMLVIILLNTLFLIISLISLWKSKRRVLSHLTNKPPQNQMINTGRLVNNWKNI